MFRLKSQTDPTLKKAIPVQVKKPPATVWSYLVIWEAKRSCQLAGAAPKGSGRGRKDGARHRAGNRIGGTGAELGEAEQRVGERLAPGRGGEHHVAIERRVHRIDRAREAGLRHDGEPLRLPLGQRRIGRHHHQGGALALAALGADGAAHRAAIGGGRPSPPNSASCSNGAAQNQGPPPITTEPAALTAASAPTAKPVRGRRRGRADAALEVERGGSQAGPDAAERKLGRGALGGRIAEIPIGGEAAPILVAAGREVEQDRARHDRHPGGAHRKAAAALAQPGLHAGAGFEPESRAARQGDPVDALDGGGGLQQIGLARAGPAAAHIDAGDRRLLEHDRGDARAQAVVLRMADQDAGDIGDEVACGHEGPLGLAQARGVIASESL